MPVRLTGGGAGGLTNINVSAGTTSNNLSAITFSNLNGVSFGLDGSTITASVAAAAGLTNLRISAGTTSNLLSDVTFSNSNGVSFGINASTITASVATSLTNINISAGTTSNNLSAVVFSNSNNISFGLNGSTVTATATVASTQGSINLSAGTTSNLASAFTFSNSNGVSFGLNASTITGSVATSLTNIRVSAGTTSNLLSAITFSNLNGISFGLDASTVTASVATSLTNIRVSAGTTSNLLSALTFSDLNGISFGLDASTVTASHNGLTSQSNQAFSAAGGSSAFQTLGFSDHRGFSFTNSNGSVALASLNLSLFAVSNTTQSTSGTANHSALSFGGAGVASVGVTGGSVVISVPAGAPSPVNFSAGTTSSDLGSVVFSNSNGVSFGLNGSTITATVQTNYLTTAMLSNAATISNIRVSAGTTSNLLSDITFSNSNGVTFGLNASTITASVTAPSTLSSYWEGMERLSLLVAPGNGSVSLVRFQNNQYISGTQIAFQVYQSISSSAVGNTYGQQWTIQVGVFTNDTAGNRLMSLSSGSTQTTYTLASNSAGATQLIGSGVRPITCPLNMNMTPGIYYLAFAWSTNTFSSGTASTALNRTVSMIGRGAIMSASFAPVSAYDQATAATVNRLWPQGILSNGAISSVPLTISHSQITMTGASHSNANLAFFIRA